MDIAKNYSPADIEARWYDAWEHAGIFKAVPDPARKPYTIVIPPPNVTGVLHMGHMLNNTIQDVLIRRKRMEGYNALWVPGTDHASIATEAKVVQMLAEQGIQKQDIGREAFLQHAYAWKDKYGGIILQQLRKLGASCDWSRTAFTMDPAYYRDVIRIFCDLHDKGLIYRGTRMVNWDPAAQTAVSDEEVIRRDTPTKLAYIHYPFLHDPQQHITVATVRPETIMGDVAICVHPDDPRYQHLIGQTVCVPLLNTPIPIIADPYIDPAFGTGCLKVTPAHDPNDYEIARKHNLPVIDILHPDGTIAPAATLYIGQDRFHVRKQILKDLQAQGFLQKTEDYTSSVGYSERTNAAIEPRLSLQWFLRMDRLAPPALHAVQAGAVTLIPDKFQNTYKHWLENVRDWCLSRQLWWGHQIPAWYLRDSPQYVVAPTPDEALQKAQALDPTITPQDLRQDPDVLDTWASSWLWPIAVFDGIQNPQNPDFQYFYPTHTLVTAPEILFFWVARMIIAGCEYTQKPPFTHVYLTGIVRDKLRRKMSKSLGNSPDALQLISQYGADGVRVGMLLCSPAGNDILYDDTLVEQGRNFANKIWNAFRLIHAWAHPDPTLPQDPNPATHLATQWMRARTTQAAAEIAHSFDKFRLSEALMTLYKLIWDDFCATYLEIIKPAFGTAMPTHTQAQAAQCMDHLLHLLHPFMPFISEEIWQHLHPRQPAQFLATQTLPPILLGHQTPDHHLLQGMAIALETVTEIRAFRSTRGLSPKQPLPATITPQADILTPYAHILAKLANATPLQTLPHPPPAHATIRVRTLEIFLPQGDIDLDAERQKLQKDIQYHQGFLQAAQAKLNNPKFTANAKPEILAREQQKAADAHTKLQALQAALQALQ